MCYLFEKKETKREEKRANRKYQTAVNTQQNKTTNNDTIEQMLSLSFPLYVYLYSINIDWIVWFNDFFLYFCSADQYTQRIQWLDVS